MFRALLRALFDESGRMVVSPLRGTHLRKPPLRGGSENVGRLHALGNGCLHVNEVVQHENPSLPLVHRLKDFNVDAPARPFQTERTLAARWIGRRTSRWRVNQSDRSSRLALRAGWSAMTNSELLSANPGSPWR